MGDIGIVAVGALFMAIVVATILKDRQHRRNLARILRTETLGLCREAAELAEAICEQRARGGLFDQVFLDRYGLTEPQTFPGLVASLWRLPPDISWRAVELHGHLSLARTRFAAWRSGAKSETSTYLLLSALTRSAKGGEGLLREIADLLGQRGGWTPHMPLASALIESAEQEDMYLVDLAYWSVPA